MVLFAKKNKSVQLSCIYNSNTKELLEETDFYMHAHLKNHTKKGQHMHATSYARTQEV